MKLNHLNLPVPDVTATAQFFETYFGLRCVERKGNGVLAVLLDETGTSLILSNFDRSTVPAYPQHFHVGFLQDTKDQVRELHSRLAAGGHAVPEPKDAHGAWGFYFTAPGGILVEVSCRATEAG